MSLVDDDHGRSNSAAGGRLHPPDTALAADKAKKSTLTTLAENADLLYEYFPLSLDDWLPPVDAIYRPHVVHHTNLPPEIKAQQVMNKTKRYFTADD